MKRGKDDDKNMGPMFPRLHVNDTEKGGPRAPPRNKMALYEQLTIPSHRYNSGAVPLNHSNNSNLVPSTSTNQGMGRERNMYFPLYRSSPAPSYDERQARNTEAVSSSGQAEQVDSRKKPPEEDDFMVPIFSEAGKGPSDNKIQSTIESERQKHLSASRHVMPLSYGDEEANQSGGRDHAPIQRVINKDGRSSVAFDASTRYPDTLMREKDGGRWRDDASVQEEHAETHRLSTLEKTDACFRQDLEDSVPALDTRYGRDASDQVFRSTHRNVSLSLKHNPQMEFGYRDGNEVNNAPQRIVDGRSLERENVERGDDDVSETSMVDCASGLDVSPDDVVGILGQKHFWKARTAIVNQQRVFAVQVFELHRLIKVQKLIAGSPHLLLEESAIVEKAALNRSALKQYSSDYAVKALSHNIKQKDDSQKQTDKLEGTAENAVMKVPIPPPQNAIQPAGYQSFPVSPAPSPPVNTDPKMNPWSFHQPTGQQWLVPVMSPSEGLVYKPYPASSFMSPICGGCGPTPMPVNLMNSPYGAPTPPYHQGLGMPFGGQGFFFPYGMPMMNPAGSASAVDQTNPFSGPNLHGQMGQPGGRSIVQHQSSCNMPNQKNGTTPPPALRAPPPKEGELQGSTASSSSERAQVPGMAPPPPEGRDALPLFPTAPVAEISEATPPTEDRSRVIKVVPHNPGSTRESAARIFQSIQEERRRHESI